VKPSQSFVISYYKIPPRPLVKTGAEPCVCEGIDDFLYRHLQPSLNQHLLHLIYRSVLETELPTARVLRVEMCNHYS
jgi:hypothetical protein